MPLNNEIIIFEYFTSLQKLNYNLNDKIFKEAQQLSDLLIEYFCSNEKIRKVHVIRNSKLPQIKNKKIKYYLTSPKKNLGIILNSITTKKLILLAPESHKINIKLMKILRNKFELLNSNLIISEIFSSKKKTFELLNKKKIPTLSIINKTDKIHDSEIFISKPIYGTGSEKIKLIRPTDIIEINKNLIIQKFYKGTKGSFSMLCHKGDFVVLCCNKQLVEIKDSKVIQTGLVVGGLENARKKIHSLAKKIVSNFSGLFGFIGVDIILNNGKWHIVEVNSRFTSSLIGLEKAYGKEIIKKITNFYLNKKIEKTGIKLRTEFRVKFH